MWQLIRGHFTEAALFDMISLNPFSRFFERRRRHFVFLSFVFAGALYIAVQSYRKDVPLGEHDDLQAEQPFQMNQALISWVRVAECLVRDSNGRPTAFARVQQRWRAGSEWDTATADSALLTGYIPIQEVRLADMLGDIDFPEQSGIGDPRNYPNAVRLVGNFLRAHSSDAARRGDRKAAVESALLLLRFGDRVAGSASSLEVWGEGVDCQKYAYKIIDTISNNADVRELQLFLSRLDGMQDSKLARVLKVEFSRLSKTIKSGRWPVFNRPMPPRFLYKPNLTINELSNQIRELILLCPLPASERSAPIEPAKPKFIASNGFGQALLNLPLVSGSAILDKHDSEKAFLNLLRIKIGLLIHKRNVGRLPPNLLDLAPGILASVPSDPYSGHPVGYRIEEAGARIWVIGRDLIDDGSDESNAVNFDAMRNPTLFIVSNKG